MRDLKHMQYAFNGHGCYSWDPQAKTKMTDSIPVPWPIRWLMGHHHYKHRWASNNLMNVGRCMEFVKEWARKLRWRSALEDSDSNQFYRFKSKFPSSSQCPDMNNQKLETCISATFQAVFQACFQAKMSHIRPHRPPIVKFAFSLLSAYETWSFVKT